MLIFFFFHIFSEIIMHKSNNKAKVYKYFEIKFNFYFQATYYLDNL